MLEKRLADQKSKLLQTNKDILRQYLEHFIYDPNGKLKAQI